MDDAIVQPKQTGRMPDLTGMLWRFLRRPMLLVGIGVFMLLLILCTFYLPQIPTPIAGDPSSAARWFNTVSADYGAVGNLLRGLGLFDLLHSPLLRVLLVILGLLLSIHLAEQVAAILLSRSLERTFKSGAAAGEVIALPQALPLYRTRERRDGEADAVVTSVRTLLSARFGRVEQVSIAGEEAEAGAEVRLFASRQQIAHYLRLLGLIGLLLGLGAIWFITLLAWEISPPSIAPGESYSYTPQKIELAYTAIAPLNEPESPVHDLALQVQIGEESGVLPVDSASSIRMGDITVDVQPGPPGLLVSSVNGAEILAIQDQANANAVVGLVFPDEGNEQVVRLPAELIGVRIVRSSSEPKPDYIIEVIDVVGGIERESVELEIQNGESKFVGLKGETLSLRFDPLPALDVRMRYLPNVWLLLTALGLAVVGAVGFLMRPAFLLAQIVPTHGNKMVFIAQSDRQGEMRHVRKGN